MNRSEPPALARGVVLLCAVAAVAVVASCRSTPEETVRFWAMGREGEVVARLLSEFERSHPGIRVETQQLPWTAAHEKLLTAFAGDATPDLCQLGNTWLPEFAALGALEALGRRVAASSIIVPDDFFAGIWDTNVVAGALYGVPWYVDTRLLFYRRDLLAAAGYASPPASWGQWRDMMAAIKARAPPGRFAILLPSDEVEPLLALALQQDMPLLRDGDRWGNFESEGFRRALGFYVDTFREGYAPATSGNDIANVWNEFGRGRFVFYVSGPWNIEEFKRRLPADAQQSWATAPLPGPTGPGASIAGGSSLVVFRGSRHKDAAWQLIEFLSRPDIQARFHQLTGDLPPRRAAWLDPGLVHDVYAGAFRDQLERVRPLPKVAEWERIADQIRAIAERTVAGQMTVDQAAKTIDDRADAILEKRRWMLTRGALK
ncbi:MAG TPA: sugar ABC transporter substrate-binding protein [Casimicrobiaceae bacterium]|nr:sugar ABC transporter substrate-binding protein [Casimicrobiaceae bacterium]